MTLIQTPVEEEMKKAYLDYSMSVIIGRALPDARDGLKPVQRRILYAMLELGLTPGKAFRKSATIVGTVMSNYHPHGDASIYDTLVRLAQPFTLRYPLVEGQGNFGSIDGDSPAQMRYTEARLSRAGMLMLQDIDKDTVDFQLNFDGRLKEPVVLPAAFPNLLCNGSSGIAVGMATSIPPHNIRDVTRALIHLIHHPDATLTDILPLIQGPDFPTGGEIVNAHELPRIYETGRGILRVRGVWRMEDHAGRRRMIISEIPYEVKKSSLLEEIAEAVRQGLVQGVHDLRDESDKRGIRIVIELKKDVQEDVLINQLLKHTRLEASIPVNILTIHEGRPVTLSLLGLLKAYLTHRESVVERRTRFLLRKAEARAHILQGLLTALKDIDAIITLIRSSPTVDEARAQLEERGFSREQADAILDMRLQRLAALERKKIEDELASLEEEIKQYKRILSSRDEIYKLVEEELRHAEKLLGDERRTRLSQDMLVEDVEALIPDEETFIIRTARGYVKRVQPDEYRVQHRGGKGILTGTLEDDHVVHVLPTRTKHSLLILTSHGRAIPLKAWQIPAMSRTSRGRPIQTIIPLEEGEHVQTILDLNRQDEKDTLSILFATRKGIVKRTRLTAFTHLRKTGIRAILLDEEDELLDARIIHDDDHIILTTREGMSIRFAAGDVRLMGRTARGVRGISLKEDDEVVSLAIPTPGAELLTLKENGYGKKTPLDAYRVQKRGGMGVRTINTRDAHVIAAKAVQEEDEVLVITWKGKTIRIPARDIPSYGRTARGVRIIRLDENDRVVSMSIIRQTGEEA